MKIAVFGSAFNPPSLGHKSVLERLSHFDLILMVPSIAHAWGKEMLDYDTRCEMVTAFMQDLNLPQVELSTIERTLLEQDEGAQAVTTFALLSALQCRYPESELTFVIGPDNFLQFSKFYKAQEITQQWSILACPETLPVRSTHIRQHLEAGSSIEGLTTTSVSQFIHSHKLYQQR